MKTNKSKANSELREMMISEKLWNWKFTSINTIFVAWIISLSVKLYELISIIGWKTFFEHYTWNLVLVMFLSLFFGIIIIHLIFNDMKKIQLELITIKEKNGKK